MNLVSLESADGQVGHAVSRYPMPSSIHEFLTSQALPSIIGKSAEQPEAIRSALYWELSRTFSSGVFVLAASLIDQAVWDLRGRILDRPVWQLLGGSSPELDAYITFGTYRYDIDELQTLARRLTDEGHTALKMVLGAADNPTQEIFGAPGPRDLERDMARVAAVREVIGPDVTLYVDANKNPSLPMARQYEQRLREFSPGWFEDPVDAADPSLLRQLRDTSVIPIAAGGSNLPGVRAARDLLLAQAVDYIQPDVTKCGGISEQRRIAWMADDYGVKYVGHGWNTALGLAADLQLATAMPNVDLVEYIGGSAYVDGIVAAPFVLDAEGMLPIPDLPGLGVRLDPDKVARYAPNAAELFDGDRS
jgi:L-alanine-DL-glutamate epimerase-like enolase superfamily enzyme